VIVYDLKCRDGHTFEGWFKDRGAFEEQRDGSLIACPVCGSNDATVMPSSIAILGKESASSCEKQQTEKSPVRILEEFKAYITNNFDDVGDEFSEVALRIHHGEEDKRNIKGTTTQDEEETLREEGVQFIKLSLPKLDS
jgi:hypothetical protein